MFQVNCINLPVWIRSCSRRELVSRKCLAQNRQENGLSPMWRRSCCRSDAASRKDFSQVLHLNGLVSVWVRLCWVNRWRNLNDFPHMLQRKGRSIKEKSTIIGVWSVYIRAGSLLIMIYLCCAHSRCAFSSLFRWKMLCHKFGKHGWELNGIPCAGLECISF